MNRILFIDGKKDICDFISRFFRERNFEVLSACNTADALISVKNDSPDIILLEPAISKEGCLDILGRIRRLKRDAKIVIVSEIGDIETIQQAKKMGAISYLTKPVVLGELIDVVVANIGKKRRFFKLRRVCK